MAKVTVDDCLQYIPNRFEMTLVVAQRARQINMGRAPLIEGDDAEGKPVVVALREVANGKVGQEIFRDVRR